jgi:MoxR-like ATPase
LAEYILKIVRYTRPQSPEFESFRTKVAAKDERAGRILGMVEYGASPRSVQTFAKLGMVRAACNGRAHVMPEDVQHFAAEVLRHRIILKPEAAYTADGRVTSDDVIKVILKYTHVVQDPTAYQRPTGQ